MMDRIDNLTSHNLFGNLYFDFINNSPLTPYVGFGAGIGFTDMGYTSYWARNFDASRITTGEGLPNAVDIRQSLAGTSSFAQSTLSDTLFGYQVLFGVDYALAESITLDIKARQVYFGSLNDGGFAWDPLRGHRPNLRNDGSEPVSGHVETNGIGMFGVHATLKYHF